jgi:glucokinase
MDLVLAIDFDDDRGAVGIVDPSGAVLETEPFERGAGGDIVDALDDALAQVWGRATRLDGAVVACGVATELAHDVARVAEVRDVVGRVTPVPLFTDTPGRAYALAEGWVGAAKGVDHYAVLDVGATVRGGIVLDGRLLDGGSGKSGGLGHVIVVPDGRRCTCGAKGCLQAEVSVPAIESRSGRPLNEPSYEVMQHVGALVGIALASVANLLDVRLLVCGGRVAREYASTMFLAAQSELDARCRLTFSRGARVVLGRTTETPGLVGAAAVGLRGLSRSGVV